MESELVKIKKTVRTTSMIITVLTYLSYVGIAVCLLYLAAAIFKPGFTFPNPFPPEVLHASMNADTFMRNWAALLLSTYLAYGILGIVILKSLAKIVATVTDGNPFEQNNYRLISMIGWSIMVGINLIAAIQYLLGSTLLQFSIVTDATLRITAGIDWKITLLALFSGTLVLILAQIFKYGTYLQNEYDATL